MNATLRRIDEQAAILTQLFDNGRIGEDRYLKAIKKLTDKAVKIMDRMAK
jgi:hypothetical protein